VIGPKTNRSTRQTALDPPVPPRTTVESERFHDAEIGAKINRCSNSKLTDVSRAIVGSGKEAKHRFHQSNRPSHADSINDRHFPVFIPASIEKPADDHGAPGNKSEGNDQVQPLNQIGYEATQRTTAAG
jgi:hypothetical protein